MPKLRNAGTDIEQFVQWIGRKCRNHNPLAELSILNRQTLNNVYPAQTKGELFIPADKTSTLVYKAGDRAFEISVKEIPANRVTTLAKKERITVGS